MAIRKIGRFYYIYFRDENGNLHTFATGQTVEAEARKIDRANQSRIQNLRKKKILLELCAPEQQQEIQSNDRSAAAQTTDLPLHKRGTIRLNQMFEIASKYRALSRFHRGALNDFIEVTGLKYADQVTPKIARDYLEKRFGNGNGKSYNNYRTYLNTIFRLTLIESGLPASPFASLVPRRVTDVESHRPITDEEFRRLFAAAEEPYRTALLIGYHTGLRLMDCFRLSPDCIENGWIVKIPGKTRRYRRAVQIPVHRELAEHLNRIQVTGSAPYCQNAPSEQRISAKFQILFTKCGVNNTSEGKASFHGLRSSAATRFREHGIEEHAIEGMLGHTKTETTNVYSHDRITPLKILDLPGVLLKK